MPKDLFIGIDGCRGGWAVARIRSNQLSLFLVDELAGISALAGPGTFGFIDMPIGLTDMPEGRLCEYEARSVMPPAYKPSIFFCPSASAISAPNFSEANTIQRSVTGKGLSIQAWNIVPKIRQVQEQNPILKHKGIHLQEAHPELCFAQLSGGFLSDKKRTAAGQKQRISVLEQFINLEPVSNFLAATKRKNVGVDDVLDCVCLAVSARYSKVQAMGTFPESANMSEHGKMMEIVYPRCSCLFNKK